MYGLSMPTHGPYLTVVLPALSAFLYLIAFVVNTKGFKVDPIHKAFLYPHRSGIAGLSWSVNWIFLLMANPFVPSFIQTILNEANLPVVILASWFLLNERPDPIKCLGASIVIIGAVTSVWKTINDGVGTFKWDLIYFVGTAGIALAASVSEYFLKLQTADNHKEEKFAINIFWNLAWTNVWLTIINVLGLFFYSIPFLADMSVVSIWDGIHVATRCLSGGEGYKGDDCTTGIWSFWGASICSIVGTWVQYEITLGDSAVYATILQSVSPLVAVIFFSFRFFMGKYYSPALVANMYIWIGMAVVLVGVLIYKLRVFSVKRGITWMYSKRTVTGVRMDRLFAGFPVTVKEVWDSKDEEKKSLLHSHDNKSLQ